MGGLGNRSGLSYFKEAGMNPYKELWSRIGGRPWTYIIRDLWHEFEFIWIVGLVSLGVWLGHNYDWQSVLAGWIIFAIGYCAGHFFWGTPHIPNQQGRNESND